MKPNLRAVLVVMGASMAVAGSGGMAVVGCGGDDSSASGKDSGTDVTADTTADTAADTASHPDTGQLDSGTQNEVGPSDAPADNSVLAAAELAFANAVVSTYCTSQTNCCKEASDSGAFDVGHCETVFQGYGWEANLPPGYQLFASGNIAYDSAKAATCLAAIANLPCGHQTAAQYVAVTQACQLVLTGTMPSGQSGCLSSFECATNTYCAEPGDGGVGVCTPLATQGQACVTTGAPPIPDFMCSYLGTGNSGLYCDLFDPVGSTNYGTCQALLPNGSNCWNAAMTYFDDQACATAACGDLGCGTSYSLPYPGWCSTYTITDAGGGG